MCIQQIHFQNTIVKEEHPYPININGNVSYEGNLKHGKYKRDSLVSWFFLFTGNRDMAIAGESFSFKTILRSSWYTHLSYGVYISQLIRYASASSNYSDFPKRHFHLRNRLLDQGYEKIRLIRSLKKFIFRYQYLVEIYSISAEKIISDAFSYSENV